MKPTRLCQLFAWIILISPAAYTAHVDPTLWLQWLTWAEQTGAEPLRTVTSLPENMHIMQCSKAKAVTSGPQSAQAIAILCFEHTRVRGPEKGPLTKLSNEQRLLVLKHLTLRVQPEANINDLNLSLFTSHKGVQRINSLAGRVRHHLFMEIDRLQNSQVRKDLLNSNSKAPQSHRLVTQTLIHSQERHLQLLDHLFPDAAAWHFLLKEQKKL